MKNFAPSPYDIRAAFAVLQPDLRATPVAVGPTLYESLDRDFDAFHGHWLFSRYAFSEPWPSWERHPAGDEIVYLLSGDVTFVLEGEDVEREVRLSRPGSYVIVPRNTWHTARPHTATEMLFITPGEGTEHRKTVD
ncbi:MAG: cupin domain-containing protein [Proteobacteria bacterium]|nr:cupin domain-containing protein [Pseudomonadota bacterium]